MSTEKQERYGSIWDELDNASQEQTDLANAGNPEVPDLKDPEHKVVSIINGSCTYPLRVGHKVVPDPRNGELAQHIHDFVMNARTEAQGEVSE